MEMARLAAYKPLRTGLAAIGLVAAVCIAIANGDDATIPNSRLVLAKEYPEDSQLTAVSAEDPNSRIVTDEVRSITDPPPKAIYRNVLHGSPKQIHGRGISRLFPDHRFYTFSFGQKPASESQQLPGLLYNIRFTIAVAKDNSVFRLKGMTTCDSFGEFLARQNVKIEDAADARLVADAYSEIFRQPRAVSISQVSDRQWRFMIPRDQPGVRRDVLVYLDAQSKVRSTEYRVVSSPREDPGGGKEESEFAGGVSVLSKRTR